MRSSASSATTLRRLRDCGPAGRSEAAAPSERQGERRTMPRLKIYGSAPMQCLLRHVKATGDFNADGKADILWQNSSGEAYIQELNGTTAIGAGSLGNPGPNWHEIASGDFNKDGYSDILWQNSNGEVYIWEMNGTTQ